MTGRSIAGGRRGPATLRAARRANGTHAPKTTPRPLLRTLLALAPLLALLFLTSPPAQAAVTHQYEKPLSEAFSKGVPTGCAVTPNPPLIEPPCVPGPLTGASAIAVDEGSAWILDSVENAATHENSTRVDRFDAGTGAFLGPQIDEGEGVSELNGAVGVRHPLVGDEQVYVDSAQGVAVYDGKTATLDGVWTGAHTKSGVFHGEHGVGEHSELGGVAVDDSASASDQAKGDVYVATNGEGAFPKFNLVDVFDPEAAKAGEEPAEPVAELAGTCPSPGQVVGGAGCEAGVGEIPFRIPEGVAVSPANGDLVVADGSPENGLPPAVMDVFEPVGIGAYRYLFSIPGAGPLGNVVPFIDPIQRLAVNGSTGEIYLEEDKNGVVDQFSATGEYLAQIKAPSGSFPERASLGVDAETGDLLVGDTGGLTPLAVFGPSTVIPDVATTPATEIHATHVQLNGTVKLDKAGPAQCVFEYGTTRSYGKEVSCEPAEVKESEELPAGTPVPVKGTIGLPPEEELQPDTTYYYRVRALNGNSAHIVSDGEGTTEDQGEVKTSGPGLHGESASEVASTAASLEATIDPDGSSTYYYFQYNTTGTAICETQPKECTSVPVSPEGLGSAPGDLNVSQRIQGLTPETVYHYRVVVLSEPDAGVTEVFPEPDRTFTTQPPGSGFSLPDGRAWELVSPPDKHGAQIMGIAGVLPFNGWMTKAASSGGAFTYFANKPTEDGSPGYGFGEQVLSARGAAGWSSRDISLPHTAPTGLLLGQGTEYRFFSEDLSLGLAEPFGQFTSLKPDVFPADSEKTPYLRHNLTCGSESSTCFEPLVTGAPGYADVPAGTRFGGLLHGDANFVAASPDGKHVVLNSKVELKAGGGALFEWTAGRPFNEQELTLVSVKPEDEGGQPSGGEVGFKSPGNSTTARGAVSDDGSRVVWEDERSGLYLTDTALPETAANRSVRLDVPQAQCVTEKTCGGGTVEPQFQIANREGSRVFFSDSQQLLAGAGAGDLYECAVSVGASGPSCALRDVAPGAGVLGEVLGASEDGSYVYFLSGGVLAGSGATSPGANLYVDHYNGSEWKPTFIGALSGADHYDWYPEQWEQTARVSPNGQWLTFMSQEELTGYDNHDAHSGRSDQEVFLYNGETHKLLCASCNPTGARPDGVELGVAENRLIAGTQVSKTQGSEWLAANIPGGTPYEAGHAVYQPRFLSNSGRLFFNSSDALVPQDVNNQEDVYQWEPSGTGSCSSSAPGYNAGTGGCVALISSGTSPGESAFLDASENGNDVFFLTSEKLVPQDIDTSLDVYDAHVCGAEGVPCTTAPVSSPACETSDACRTASPAQPELFGAPASATFSGPGNQTAPPPAGPKPKTAEQLRIERLDAALKACRKKHNAHNRALCEKPARKAHAKKASAKKSSTAKSSAANRTGRR